jgi:hypothetical protein
MPIYNPVRVGGRTPTLISTVTVSTAVANVTFSSLSAAYLDLYVRFNVAGSDAATQYFRMQFNGDTGTTYGSTELSWGSLNNANHYNGLTYIICGKQTPSAVSWSRSSGDLWIYDYTSTTYDKIVQGSMYLQPFTAPTRTNDGERWLISGKWGPSTPAAITSVVFTPTTGNFVAGTVVSLYGVSA